MNLLFIRTSNGKCGDTISNIENSFLAYFKEFTAFSSMNVGFYLVKFH